MHAMEKQMKMPRNHACASVFRYAEVVACGFGCSSCRYPVSFRNDDAALRPFRHACQVGRFSSQLNIKNQSRGRKRFSVRS
ncbi:hypothetical protein BDV97DRAFT_77205 [Delphinella strobiligena]|nr:hypothetical protein BDV97DRAFT_77205 [Delphinella strobiligena]